MYLPKSKFKKRASKKGEGGRDRGSERTKDTPLTGPSISGVEQQQKITTTPTTLTSPPINSCTFKTQRSKEAGERGRRQTKDTPLASSSISNFICRQCRSVRVGWVVVKCMGIDMDEYGVEVAVEVDVGERVVA